MEKLFQPPEKDILSTSRHYVEYRSTSNLNSGGPLEFSIPPSPGQLIDLKNTRLFVKVKITKEDGADLGEEDLVTPINVFLHSMFQQAEVYLQQQKIPGGQYYAYGAYLKTLLESTNLERQNRLTCAGYYKDYSTKMDNADPNDKTGNIAIITRNGFYRNSRITQLEGDLCLGLFQQDKPIINGVHVDIKLWPAKNAFSLMSGVGNPKYKIMLVDAGLKVCQWKLSPTLEVSLSETILQQPAIYPFISTQIKTYQINSGVFEFKKEDMFPSGVPLRLKIVMLNAEAYNGSFTKNPFNFKHYNLNRLGIYVDDVSVPGKPLQFNYDKSHHIPAYSELTKMYPNADINKAEFDEGYSVYLFDMQQTNFPLTLPVNKKGNVKIEAEFSKALNENVVIIICAEFPTIMCIDNLRNVSL